MLKIALLDDKAYGLEQIKEIHFGEEYELVYFDTFKSFQESPDTFDIIYLDYFLDKDGIKGTEIITHVETRTKKIIGFSSAPFGNEEFKKVGVKETVIKMN